METLHVGDGIWQVTGIFSLSSVYKTSNYDIRHHTNLCLFTSNAYESDRIGGVMVSGLASKAVDHGFEARSNQTKDAVLRRKSND